MRARKKMTETDITAASTPPPLPQRRLPRASWRLLFCLGAWAAIVLGLITVYTVPLEGQGIFPQCQIYQTTGLYCPGCGMTRALYDVSQFHLIDSLGHNLFTFPMVGFLLIMLVLETWSAWTGRPAPTLPVAGRTGYTVLFLLLGFMLLRNLPWWPFTILAP